MTTGTTRGKSRSGRSALEPLAFAVSTETNVPGAASPAHPKASTPTYWSMSPRNGGLYRTTQRGVMAKATPKSTSVLARALL